LFAPIDGGTGLYQLDVALLHDKASHPLQAGTAKVSVPESLSPAHFAANPLLLPLPASDQACLQQNRQHLQRFLKLQGKASPEMTEELFEWPTD
jgi:hypothetical protein